MSARGLDERECAERLQAFPNWTQRDGGIERTFEFADFRTAFGFMASVATAAEAMNHHPEWRNVYRTVEVRLTTHDAGGLTDLDFELAKEMDRLGAGRGGP